MGSACLNCEHVKYVKPLRCTAALGIKAVLLQGLVGSAMSGEPDFFASLDPEVLPAAKSIWQDFDINSTLNGKICEV